MTNRADRIQSCVDHINTAVDVDPWAKELVAEMGKEILEQLNNPNDCISREAAKEHFHKRLTETALNNIEISDVYEDIANSRIDVWFGELPSVHPTYTDEQIQKAQEMEQAQLDKAFALGREDAKAEIVRCKDCKWCVEHYDTDGNAPYWICKNWDGGTDADGFCYEAERRTDEA